MRALVAIASMILVLVLATVASALEANPTGYYLPRGYKVRAEVYVPGSPFWPGELQGDVVGISCQEYQVLVVGVGYKTWSGEADSGVRVYWREGGTEKEVARKYHLPEGRHTVEIVYGYDGYIYFSVDGNHLYGFAATKDKYVIVSRGAVVSPPEPLPSPSTTVPTGQGYNPRSVGELRAQYLLLGVAVATVATALLLLVGRGRRVAVLLPLILLLPTAVATAETPLYTLYPSGKTLSEGDSVVATLDPSTGEEQLIGVREGDYDYFIGLFPDADVIGVYKGFNNGEGQVALWQTSHENRKHEVRIEFHDGIVMFYVDGALRYSFKASKDSYGVLVCNVALRDARAHPATYTPHLLLGLGVLVLAVVVVAQLWRGGRV